MWGSWIIFIVGAHGSGKTVVSRELLRRLRILLNPLRVEVGFVEVSDIVRAWQVSEGRVDPDNVFNTELRSVRLHKFLWATFKSFKDEVVICCGAREKHLLSLPDCTVAKTTSIALSCPYEVRRVRFFAREQFTLDLKKRWERSEVREGELGLAELLLACDSSISTASFSVEHVVDQILTSLLVNLWRNE